MVILLSKQLKQLTVVTIQSKLANDHLVYSYCEQSGIAGYRVFYIKILRQSRIYGAVCNPHGIKESMFSKIYTYSKVKASNF
jgi:hypothetical protein